MFDLATLPTQHVTDTTTAYRTPHTWRQEFADNASPALERSRLLDWRTDPHPILDALMHDALRRLSLVADGGVMALRERVSGGGAGSVAPSSELAADMDRLWREYARASTHRRRLRAIKQAQEECLRLKYSQSVDPALVRHSPEWRERLARDPRPRRVVAEVFRVSSKTITAARKEFGVR